MASKTKQHRIVTEREGHILQAAYTYRFITLAQLTRLYFSPRSINHVGEYTKRLAEDGFLARFPVPSISRGNHEFVYTLATKGMKYMATLGQDIAQAYPPGMPPPSYQHINHTLAVNDVLIAATLLAQQHPAIELRNVQSEWMLKRTPLSVTLTSGKGQEKLTVIADGWLDIRFRLRNHTYQTAIWLEVDRGTEEQPQFRRRVRGLYAVIASKVCQQQFGAASPVIAFLTTAGNTRCNTMRAWVEQELTALQKQDDAEAFLLGTLPQDAVDPEALFLLSGCTTPFLSSLCPIVDLS